MKHSFKIKILLLVLLYVFSINIARAQTPALFFGNPPKQVEEGDRLTVDIKVRSPLQAINAISGTVSFTDALVDVVSISRDKSIMNIWTQDPRATKGKLSFEGVILNPGYQGNEANIVSVTFEAKRAGTVFLNFIDGAVLANDGLGTNILTSFNSTSFKIAPSTLFSRTIASETTAGGTKMVALPVITEYSQMAIAKESIYVKGKGEPSAITKIIFKDISVKSVGEKLIGMLQTKKKKLEPVLVKNDPLGAFEYTSASNLVAGVYNATPFLVDNNTSVEKAGLGVQLLVSDSKIVKALVVVINVLGLLIPIVGLGVIIYFIPWYSFRRMRVLNKKLGLEEEKIELSGHQLERQDKILDKNVENMVKGEEPNKPL